MKVDTGDVEALVNTPNTAELICAAILPTYVHLCSQNTVASVCVQIAKKFRLKAVCNGGYEGCVDTKHSLGDSSIPPGKVVLHILQIPQFY